jgi:hypothetical protein
MESSKLYTWALRAASVLAIVLLTGLWKPNIPAHAIAGVAVIFWIMILKRDQDAERRMLQNFDLISRIEVLGTFLKRSKILADERKQFEALPRIATDSFGGYHNLMSFDFSPEHTGALRDYYLFNAWSDSGLTVVSHQWTPPSNAEDLALRIEMSDRIKRIFAAEGFKSEVFFPSQNKILEWALITTEPSCFLKWLLAELRKCINDVEKSKAGRLTLELEKWAFSRSEEKEVETA